MWPIDHDDGSCFYEDSYNCQVHGGRKDHLGQSEIDHHEIYVHSDANGGAFGSNVCLGDYSPTRSSSGWNETWIENTCVLYQNPVPYNIGNCDIASLFVPYLASNKIYIPADAHVVFTYKVNGKNAPLRLEQWQSYSLEDGTTMQTAPAVQTIFQWGREMLQSTN